jgi:hypothetical protein
MPDLRDQALIGLMVYTFATEEHMDSTDPSDLAAPPVDPHAPSLDELNVRANYVGNGKQGCLRAPRTAPRSAAGPEAEPRQDIKLIEAFAMARFTNSQLRGWDLMSTCALNAAPARWV